MTRIPSPLHPPVSADRQSIPRLLTELVAEQDTRFDSMDTNGVSVPMPRCAFADDCAFFTADVGYSPELNRSMKIRFCLTDNTGCARLAAIELVGRESVPDDLLPTEEQRLAALK